MSSTTIDTRGTVDSASGTGLTVTVPATFSSTISVASPPTTPVQGLVASASVTAPGVYTLSNATPAGYVLPTPASVPGGVLVFRATTAQAHFLTGSASNNLGKFITDGTSQGSKVTLAAVIGSSVSLISDGLNFCVMAQSGSLAFAGT